MTTTSNTDSMNMTEARKVGREMQRAGYQFVELIQDLDTGECRLRALNRCMVQRTVGSLHDWADLKASEVAR